MAATGYRFARYYTHDPEYRQKGPPEIVLRLIAPIVLLSTIAVFVTGVGLLIDGPADRNPMLLLHKVTFIVWIVFTSLHILGHLAATAKALGVVNRGESDPVSGAGAGAGAGAVGRWIALTGAIVGGLVLALALIPEFAAWTGHAVFVHRHHHH
jgi:hypothetical protein